jgi:hypothetical protein
MNQQTLYKKQDKKRKGTLRFGILDGEGARAGLGEGDGRA